jgi:hypothetical protein
MEQLERTVVQLWEAKRLAAWGDIAHGRLALLLLDNAAEMSLMRTAQASLIYAEMYNNMAYLVRDVEPDDEMGQDLKKKLEAGTISKRRKKQIERSFDALVDYVFENEDLNLPVEFGECLKILHRYRNAAYHRDTVRADVLGPAVQILFFLCCHLLKSERQVFHEINVAPDGILDVFGDTPRTPRGQAIHSTRQRSLDVSLIDSLKSWNSIIEGSPKHSLITLWRGWPHSYETWMRSGRASLPGSRDGPPSGWSSRLRVNARTSMPTCPKTFGPDPYRSQRKSLRPGP